MMIKKLIILSVFVLGATLTTQAQFNLGIKGGVSSSRVDFKNPSTNFTQFTEEGKITGFHAGVFARLNVVGILLQPELLLTSSGGTFNMPDDAGGTTVQEIGFTNLDVPILVGYKLGFLRAYVGPVASVMINTEYSLEDYKEAFNSTNWGYQIGTGVDISRITADVRYERLSRPYTDASGNVDFRNKQVILSLGYKLFGK
jgi:hypothetical protein